MHELTLHHMHIHTSRHTYSSRLIHVTLGHRGHRGHTGQAFMPYAVCSTDSHWLPRCYKAPHASHMCDQTCHGCEPGPSSSAEPSARSERPARTGRRTLPVCCCCCCCCHTAPFPSVSSPAAAAAVASCLFRPEPEGDMENAEGTGGVARGGRGRPPSTAPSSTSSKSSGSSSLRGRLVVAANEAVLPASPDITGPAAAPLTLSC
mmetsp:Transcript_14821/g.32183  ORF Transcript_14821/g.32183 Transcript_14821/m.32183 type:complete len:205 (-) Transcript_14821:437-1051(-)